MANDVVICADGLGKKYLIGHESSRERYLTLRDLVARNVHRLGRTAKDLVRGRPMIAGDEFEELWALKNVTFGAGEDFSATVSLNWSASLRTRSEEAGLSISSII